MVVFINMLNSYSCNGRCGAGCTGTAIGDVYTQDCFSHDVCSYFNDSTDGARYVCRMPRRLLFRPGIPLSLSPALLTSAFAPPVKRPQLW